MEISKILSCVDHTLLLTTATSDEIKKICEDALCYRTASVCIPPSYVAFAKKMLCGKVAVCTVIGFPNGYATTATKIFETTDAIKNGADEIDMVINLGWVKDSHFEEIEAEIKSVKAACGDRILKVIIETCQLTEEEKIAMCKIVTNAGANFIKTSTGFSTSGATREDVALFASNIGVGVKIKAAGGIKSLDDAVDFINLGASRLGTSSIIKIVKNEAPKGY